MKNTTNTPAYHSIENGKYLVVGNRNSQGKPYFGLLQRVNKDLHRFCKIVTVDGVKYGVTITRKLRYSGNKEADAAKTIAFMKWVIAQIMTVAPAGTRLEFVPSRGYFFAHKPTLDNALLALAKSVAKGTKPAKKAPAALVTFDVVTSIATFTNCAN
jgi:hypothetical protein